MDGGPRQASIERRARRIEEPRLQHNARESRTEDGSPRAGDGEPRSFRPGGFWPETIGLPTAEDVGLLPPVIEAEEERVPLAEAERYRPARGAALPPSSPSPSRTSGGLDVASGRFRGAARESPRKDVMQTRKFRKTEVQTTPTCFRDRHAGGPGRGAGWWSQDDAEPVSWVGETGAGAA